MPRNNTTPGFKRVTGASSEQYIYNATGYLVSRRERDKAIKSPGYVPRPLRSRPAGSPKAWSPRPPPTGREVRPQSIEQRGALADWFAIGGKSGSKSRHYYNPNSGLEITYREYKKIQNNPNYVPMPAPDSVKLGKREELYWTLIREYARNHDMLPAAAARSGAVKKIIRDLQSKDASKRGRKADALRDLGRKVDFDFDVGETPTEDE